MNTNEKNKTALTTPLIFRPYVKLCDNSIFYSAKIEASSLDVAIAVYNSESSSKEAKAEAKKIMEGKMLDAAARYLCEKHGLRQVNYQYVENEKVQKIVIYWSYE